MLVGGRPQVLWEGLAELRADAPSKARGAEGERGRPPPTGTHSGPAPQPGPAGAPNTSGTNQHNLTYKPPIVIAAGTTGGLARDINVGDIAVGVSAVYGQADATAFG